VSAGDPEINCYFVALNKAGLVEARKVSRRFGEMPCSRRGIGAMASTTQTGESSGRDRGCCITSFGRATRAYDAVAEIILSALLASELASLMIEFQRLDLRGLHKFVLIEQ
jgi:hypothetical protein